MHPLVSPLAGKKISIKMGIPEIGGRQYLVTDWMDRVLKEPWQTSKNPVAIEYAQRMQKKRQEIIPKDDEVLYCKEISGWAIAVHMKEVEGIR